VRDHVLSIAGSSAGIDLKKTHLPTGWVTIEEVLRFLVSGWIGWIAAGWRWSAVAVSGGVRATTGGCAGRSQSRQHDTIPDRERLESVSPTAGASTDEEKVGDQEQFVLDASLTT
jgi:hypothetical protein